MDTPRQLLRYSLPGGLFALVATVFHLALRWAWKPQATPAFIPLSPGAVAAIVASIFIVGFIIYQVYYFFYRPTVPFFFGRLITKDRGGEILKGLKTVANDPLGRIESAYDVALELNIPRSNTEEYRRAWHTHNSVVRSLVNTISVNGGTDIKQDFVNLSDIYHALGACRLVAPAVLATTFIYAALNQWNEVTHHVAHSCEAAGLMTFIAIVMFSACHANRRDTWYTMTKQLQRDLRIWFVREPSFLPPSPKLVLLDDVVSPTARRVGEV